MALLVSARNVADATTKRRHRRLAHPCLCRHELDQSLDLTDVVKTAPDATRDSRQLRTFTPSAATHTNTVGRSRWTITRVAQLAVMSRWVKAISLI
jgi:hypothetical protein